MPPNVTHDESDQTPVKGIEAKKLCFDIGTGLDYFPVLPYLSDWLRTIFCGDYEKFSMLLHDLSSEEMKVLLSKRETMYNVSAIFHVVKGARVLFAAVAAADQEFLRDLRRQNLEAKYDHMKILIKLLCLGVDVNERDVGGQTPLFWCCRQSTHHHDVLLKMAERLIRAGADVNAKSRTGNTPLQIAAASSNVDLVQLFLANGADPEIRDNDGHTVYEACPPLIKDVLGKFHQKSAMAERKMSREAVGGSFRQCGVCGVGVGEKIMKRCSGRK